MFFPFSTTKNGAAIWSATALCFELQVLVQERTIPAKNYFYSNVEVVLYGKSTKMKVRKPRFYFFIFDSTHGIYYVHRKY